MDFNIFDALQSTAESQIIPVLELGESLYTGS